MPFAVRKYLTLLPTSLFSSAMWFLIVALESVFAGNFLGEKALAALNIIVAITAIESFVSMLVSNGAAICFSLELGRANLKRAQEFVTQGFLTSLLTAVPIALFLKFGGKLIVDFFGVSDEVGALVLEYLDWFWLQPIVESLLLLMQNLVSAEGDTRRGGISFAVFAVADTALSYLGLRLGYGLVSLAAALVISESLALALLFTHLLSSKNNLAFPRHFSFRDVRTIVSTSFGDAAARLCTALTMSFMAKLVVFKYSTEHLAVFQIVALLWGLDDLFQGLGLALQPFVTVYHGEGNPRGVRQVMNAAVVASLVVSGAIMLTLELFPGLVISALGLSDPQLVEAAVSVVRLAAPLVPAIALAGILNSYLMCIERSALAIVVSVLTFMTLPLVCALAGSAISANAFYCGFALGPAFGLIAAGVVLNFVRKGRTFPLLLDKRLLEETEIYTLHLCDEAVVAVSRKLGNSRVALLVEEALLAVRDRNQPRAVLAEVTLRGGEDPRLILRDDGEIFDITDADAKVTSIRAFVVASLMEKHLNRLNLITTGFNRNVFKIERT